MRGFTSWGIGRLLLALFAVVLVPVPTALAAQLSDCGTLFSEFEASVGETIEVTGAGYDPGTPVTFFVDGVEFDSAAAVASGEPPVGFATVEFTFTEEGSFEFETSGTANGAACATLPVGPVIVGAGGPGPGESSTVPSTGAPASTAGSQEDESPPTSTSPASTPSTTSPDPAGDSGGPGWVLLIGTALGLGVFGGGGAWLIRKRSLRTVKDGRGFGQMGYLADDIGADVKSGYRFEMPEVPDEGGGRFDEWADGHPSPDELVPGDSPHGPQGSGGDGADTSPAPNSSDEEHPIHIMRGSDDPGFEFRAQPDPPSWEPPDTLMSSSHGLQAKGQGDIRGPGDSPVGGEPQRSESNEPRLEFGQEGGGKPEEGRLQFGQEGGDEPSEGRLEFGQEQSGKPEGGRLQFGQETPPPGESQSPGDSPHTSTGPEDLDRSVEVEPPGDSPGETGGTPPSEHT